MCLYEELQSAKKHIEVIRNQRVALSREKLSMETELTKLKAEGIFRFDTFYKSVQVAQ